jgi:hypothetical protein
MMEHREGITPSLGRQRIYFSAVKPEAQNGLFCWEWGRRMSPLHHEPRYSRKIQYSLVLLSASPLRDLPTKTGCDADNAIAPSSVDTHRVRVSERTGASLAGLRQSLVRPHGEIDTSTIIPFDRSRREFEDC